MQSAPQTGGIATHALSGLTMDTLLSFYERELAHLRTYAAEFARCHPKTASRLAMSDDHIEDPHAERLVQSFSLLASRISQRLDDDYPEFTEALLGVLQPHHLRTFPACSIACFNDESMLNRLTQPTVIARGAQLHSRQSGKVQLNFRTCDDVVLAPLRVAEVVFHATVNAPSRVELPRDATGCLSIRFEAMGGTQQKPLLPLSSHRVRVFIDAEPTLAYALRDAVFLRTAAIYAEADRSGQWLALAQPILHEVGFDDQDALLPVPEGTPQAYRLLSEYFAFPEKFNFLDIDLLTATRQVKASGSVTLHFVMRQLPADTPTARLLEGVSARHLRLGCTPVINLFRHTAEPIRSTQASHVHPVLANTSEPDRYEVYSIDRVEMVRKSASGDSLIEFAPLYSLNHEQQSQEGGHYWFARRNELAAEHKQGHEIELSLVDLGLKPVTTVADTVNIELTCSNRDLPHAMAFGQPEGDLFHESSSLTSTIRLLRRPTRTQRMPLEKRRQWRVLSHLSLHHLSLSETGLAALKDMLRLYERVRSTVTTRQIEALGAIEHRAALHWMPGKPTASFVRGIEIRLMVDEAGFTGSSLHAFARVLDHFFSLYAHPNSFTQLTIVSSRENEEGEERLRCEPRRGGGILV